MLTPVQYVFQATAFLQVLEAQGSDFREEDPLRCLMFDKMEILYLLFKVRNQRGVPQQLHRQG